jgi:hypothetical protein
VQGELGENGNSTIWGDVSVYSGSWGGLETGALRGWRSVGLPGVVGRLGNLMRQEGARRVASAGV